MNGMHCSSGYLYNLGSDLYSVSKHYELPPTATIVELSLSTYFEFQRTG